MEGWPSGYSRIGIEQSDVKQYRNFEITLGFILSDHIVSAKLYLRLYAKCPFEPFVITTAVIDEVQINGYVIVNDQEFTKSFIYWAGERDEWISWTIAKEYLYEGRNFINIKLKVVGYDSQFYMYDISYISITRDFYSYAISVAGLKEVSTNLYLNEEKISSVRGGEKYNFSELIGSNIISVDQVISIGSKSRFYCPTPTITVSCGGSHVFQYFKQHYVEVNVAPEGAGTVSLDSGWYDEGKILTITAWPSPGYVFREWRGHISSKNDTITFAFLDMPISITALFGVSSSISCHISESRLVRSEALRIYGQITPPPGYSVELNVKLYSPRGENITKEVMSDANGNYEIIFTPEFSGSWSAQAFWDGDEKFCPASSNIVGFEVVPVFYKITIDTNLKEKTIYLEVDQDIIDATRLPLVRHWNESTVHTIKVEEYYNSEVNGKRYRFSKWNDDMSTRERVVNVNGDQYIKAIFIPQYYLEVDSEFGEIGENVEGWYDEGTVVTLRLKSTVSGFLVQGIFVDFKGLKNIDKIITEGVVEICIDGPRNIEVVWRKDYTQLIYIIAATIVIVIAIITVSLARKRHACTRLRKKEEMIRFVDDRIVQIRRFLESIEEESKKKKPRRKRSKK
ncbi:MAG: hypothetical protein QW385_00565 [Thermoproteota archaeon]